MDFRAVAAAPQKTTMSLETPYGLCSVSIPQADLTVAEVFEDLVEPLLAAAGYQHASIDDYLHSETV